MTTFNFTVRATDDRGAFADRDFSIKVRNTIIDRYMAMSSTGLYTSPDATTWTLRPGIGNGNSTNFQTEIVNGNGRWLMNKDATTYLLSLDGVNWSPYPLPLPAANNSTLGVIPRFSYGNGKFVVSFVYSQSASIFVYKVYTSTDGVNWTTPVTTVTSGYAASLAYYNTPGAYANPAPPPVFGNGRWNVVNPSTGVNQFFTSTDGMATFNTVTSPLGGCGNLTYVNGLWLATGLSGTTLATSVDGFTWSLQTLPAGYSDNNWRITKILYGNGRLVLVVSRLVYQTTTNAVSSAVFTSTDGVAWTNTALPVTWAPSGGTITHIATGTFHNGLFIIGNSLGLTQGILISEDGITWSRGSTNFPVATNVGSMGSINQD